MWGFLGTRLKVAELVTCGTSREERGHNLELPPTEEVDHSRIKELDHGRNTHNTRPQHYLP